MTPNVKNPASRAAWVYGQPMTHQYTKLADELDAVNDVCGSRSIREAARILRAAGAADVGGLMALHDAAAEARRVLVRGGDVPQDEADRSRQSRAALESALRVAMAPKAGFVMVPVEPTWEMTKAAIPLLQKQDLRVADISVVYAAMIAAAPQAKEQTA